MFHDLARRLLPDAILMTVRDLESDLSRLRWTLEQYKKKGNKRKIKQIPKQIEELQALIARIKKSKTPIFRGD